MKRVPLLLAVGGAAALAAVLLKRRRSSSEAPERDDNRWNIVTILRSEEGIAPNGELPAPLAALRGIETRLREAPGGRGTELAARFTSEGGDRDQLRIALRQSKQLAETGETAVVEPHPHGTRKPLGAIIAAVTDKAEGKGVL